MFDFKFDWDKSMNTGVDLIDTQHKELFRIGREIEQLLIARCIGVKEKDLLRIICELREYVAYHFYEEERLMEIYSIKGLENHRKEHTKFQNLILGIDCVAVGKAPFAELKKIKDIIQQLVFEHMIQADQIMSKELVKKMKESSLPSEH